MLLSRFLLERRLRPLRCPRLAHKHGADRSNSTLPSDRQSAGQRPETLECSRADLAHFSHTNPTETNRNRTCEKQNEFGFIVRGRPYCLVVDNWERPFALPTSPFRDSFRIAAHPRTGLACAYKGVCRYRPAMSSPGSEDEG